MDLDFLNSIPEDQLQMMMLMLQVETLPNQMPMFKTQTPNNIHHENFNFPHVSSSTFMHQPNNNNNNTPFISPSPIVHHNQEHVTYNSMAAMREMLYSMAAMQPIEVDPECVKAPKRRNVKISNDPQSVSARLRRERISERIRILKRLVPGGTKMDTATMLDEAIHYVKFLKNQVQSLQLEAAASSSKPRGNYSTIQKEYILL